MLYNNFREGRKAGPDLIFSEEAVYFFLGVAAFSFCIFASLMIRAASLTLLAFSTRRASVSRNASYCAFVIPFIVPSFLPCDFKGLFFLFC